MRRPFVALIHVLLLLYASAVPRSSSEAVDFTLADAYWGVDRPTEVSPGDAATLTVFVRYTSSTSISSVAAELTLPEGFQPLAGGEKARARYSGAFPLGAIIKLEFAIFITKSAALGNYTADLELLYYRFHQSLYTESLRVPFEVVGRPNVDIDTPTVSLYEGSQRMSIVLTNSGDAAADDLRLERVQSSGASLQLEGETSLGRLEPARNVTVPIQLYVPPSLRGGTLPVAVEASFVGPRGVHYTSAKSLLISVKQRSATPTLSLAVEPEELTIGRRSDISLLVENIGGSRLRDVRIDVSTDAVVKLFGGTTFHLERLEPGERGRLPMKVYVPPTTTAPTASLTLAAAYTDDVAGTVASDTARLSLLLRGFIDITLTDVAVIPSAPRPGTPFSITVTVTNIGTSPAYATYAVPLIRGLPLRSFGPVSVYIGNVEINQPTAFTVNLQMENTTARTVNLPVQLRYLDNLRTPYNMTFNVAIEVAPPATPAQPARQRGPEAFGLPITLVAQASAALAAVAIAVVLVRRRMRRRG